MFPPSYRNVKIILCCIDINTRYAYAYAFSKKEQTLLYIKQFIEDAEKDKRKIEFMQMDKGSEFTNSKVKVILDDIDHRFVNTGDKAAQSIVERFNGTLRRLINNYVSANNNNNWVDVFDDLLYNYNHRFNRGLGGIPVEATYETSRAKQEEQYKRAKKDFNKFKVGDNVRLLKNKDIFDKGRQTWTEKVYKIDGIKGNKFQIDDKLYRHYEIQKVVNSQDAPNDFDVNAKEDKRNKRIIRALNKEGILDGQTPVEIVRRSSRIKTVWDASLIGRRVKRDIRGKIYEGVIIEYDKEGPYHFKVKFDEVPKGRADAMEYMSKPELLKYMI
jgi:predicted transcriptional regulator YheO